MPMRGRLGPLGLMEPSIVASRQTRRQPGLPGGYEVGTGLWRRKRERYDGRIRGFTHLRDRGQPVPLEITQRETNGIYVLTLSGRLVLGPESIGLRTTIDNLLSSGAEKIVV